MRERRDVAQTWRQMEEKTFNLCTKVWGRWTSAFITISSARDLTVSLEKLTSFQIHYLVRNINGSCYSRKTNRCCTDQSFTSAENASYAWTFGINGEIEMFGLQGSPSSPTDPLFRRLSQDCPIRGLTMQTQRLLLACNLQASKREWSRGENEKTEIHGVSSGVRAECQQLRTCQMGFKMSFMCENEVPYTGMFRLCSKCLLYTLKWHC